MSCADEEPLILVVCDFEFAIPIQFSSNKTPEHTGPSKLTVI